MKTIPRQCVRGVNLTIPRAQCSHAVKTGVDAAGRPIWTPTDRVGAEKAQYMGAEVRIIEDEREEPRRVWVEERANTYVVRQGGTWLDQYSERAWAVYAASLVTRGFTPSDARDATWDHFHNS